MESQDSIRSDFNRKLRRIQRDVLRMGALVEQSCRLASLALIERDLEAARQIPPQDKQIDQLYRQIEVDCISAMAMQTPDTQEIRLLSAMMQLVRDLERIGDYAEDLAEIAVILFPYPTHGCIDRVQLMLNRCQAMLAMSLQALSDLDAKSGLEVRDRDDAVDSDYEALYNWLVHHTDIQGSVEPIVLLVLVIRYLERMADHATNIGKRVAFIVTGQR
nr:phosphate signaling complex protein PhoU [Leptolyngbya sp. 'hensonii']